MKRRDFITLLGGATAAWPLAARAQQPAGTPGIGMLYGQSELAGAERLAGFRAGLGEQGFVEGRNVAIEYRWADGQPDRMTALAADLIRRKVAVVVAGGSISGVRAVIAANPTIPIVFTTQNDPVAAGLVASLNRPGGNATGVTGLGTEIVPKQLELLHEMIPGAAKFAVLVNPTNPVMTDATVQGVRAAAQRLGLEITFINASTPNEIDEAFTTAAKQGAAGLAANEAYLLSQRDRIAALGLRHRLATIATTREAAAAGMLTSYGASTPVLYRQAGLYAGRILKGEKPGDLPVQQATKLDLIINLRTAKTLGLMLPPALLALADQVIE